MSEFSEEDFKRWLQLSMEKNCAVSRAIYYDLYFRCIRNDGILDRALNAFMLHYGLEIKGE